MNPKSAGVSLGSPSACHRCTNRLAQWSHLSACCAPAQHIMHHLACHIRLIDHPIRRTRRRPHKLALAQTARRRASHLPPHLARYHPARLAPTPTRRIPMPKRHPMLQPMARVHFADGRGIGGRDRRGSAVAHRNPSGLGILPKRLNGACVLCHTGRMPVPRFFETSCPIRRRRGYLRCRRGKSRLFLSCLFSTPTRPEGQGR